MALTGLFTLELTIRTRDVPPSNCCWLIAFPDEIIRKLPGDKLVESFVLFKIRNCWASSELRILICGVWLTAGWTEVLRVNGLPMVTVPSGFIIRTCWGCWTCCTCTCWGWGESWSWKVYVKNVGHFIWYKSLSAHIVNISFFILSVSFVSNELCPTDASPLCFCQQNVSCQNLPNF